MRLTQPNSISWILGLQVGATRSGVYSAGVQTQDVVLARQTLSQQNLNLQRALFQIHVFFSLVAFSYIHMHIIYRYSYVYILKYRNTICIFVFGVWTFGIGETVVVLIPEEDFLLPSGCISCLESFA